jgi:hypothetical protein
MSTSVNSKTAKILIALFDNCDAADGHIKIDNTDGAYMPVTIEKIDSNPMYDFYSVAHYFVQEGDLMRDPEVTFAIHRNLREEGMNWICSTSFTQDGIGYYRGDFLRFGDNGDLTGYKEQQMKNTNNFCTIWFANIVSQQNLKI